MVINLLLVLLIILFIIIFIYLNSNNNSCSLCEDFSYTMNDIDEHFKLKNSHIFNSCSKGKN